MSPVESLRSEQSWHRAVADFERRLRDSLAVRAEDAPVPAELAVRARARLGRRRRRRSRIIKVIGGVALLAAVPVGIVSVAGGGAGRPPAPVAPDGSFVVPDLSRDSRTARETMQQVTWQGIGFMVPSQWRPGVTTAWCAQAQDPGAAVPRIALPDQAGPRIACTPTSGYGVTVSAAADFEPVYASRHVWRYAPGDVDEPGAYPVDTWLSAWYDEDWLVTIATPDPGLTSRIARSVRGDEIDVNGCAVVYDELATRTTTGPRGVGAALCRYTPDGELDDSQRLTEQEAERALQAIATAPDLPGDDHCIQREGWLVTLTPAGQSAYIARYGTQGLGSCRDGIESTAPQLLVSRGSLEVTPEVAAALGLGELPAE